MKKSYHIYASITILFWSLAFVYTRLALEHFSVYSLGFARYFIASLVLLAFALVTKMPRPKLKDFPLFITAGFFGFFTYMIAFNIGQSMVTVSTASIIIATGPVLTALLARVFYKEKLSILQWSAVFIEFTGVTVLAVMTGPLSGGTGILWLLGAAFSISSYNLLQRKLTRSYSALQTTTYSIFFGTLMLGIFAGDAVGDASISPAPTIIYIVILGVFSSAVAYLFWAKAFSLAKNTAQVSNYMFLTPFVTSILGVLIIHEIPSTPTLMGGAIILLGLFIFNIDNFRR